MGVVQFFHSGHALFVAMACVLMASAAHAAVMVRTPEDLERNSKIPYALREYQALSSANVIFLQCAGTYPQVANDQAWLSEHFATLSRDVQYAYQTEYQTRVGSPPDGRMTNAITSRMHAIQRDAVNRTAQSIATGGCAQQGVSIVVHYVDKRRTLDARAAEAAATPQETPEEGNH